MKKTLVAMVQAGKQMRVMDKKELPAHDADKRAISIMHKTLAMTHDADR